MYIHSHQHYDLHHHHQPQQQQHYHRSSIEMNAQYDGHIISYFDFCNADHALETKYLKMIQNV